MSKEYWVRPMSGLNPSHDLYNEAEAAALLGISVARLYQLLDRYIFTGENRRPHEIEFTSSDLLLLAYWNAGNERPKANNVIAMPKRS